MTENLSGPAIAGPVARGPKGDPGLYPHAAWSAGTYVKDSVVKHGGEVLWLALRETAVEPTEAAVDDWAPWLDATTLTDDAQAAAEAAVAAKNQAQDFADATAADRVATAEHRRLTGLDRIATGADAEQTALDSIATGENAEQTALDRIATGEDAAAANAALSQVLQHHLGAFATDLAAYAWAESHGISKISGLTDYLNTTTHKFRVWGASDWEDIDAAAQAARGAAVDAAAAADARAADALAYKNAAEAARDATLTARDITTAARDVTTGARDVATGARDAAQGFDASAAGHLASVSTLALFAQGYVASAAASAASAGAVSGLSALGNASRAIKLTTTAVASFPDDTGKHDDAGAWIKKVPAVSYNTETLGTATRGTVANYPGLAFLVGETATLSVFIGTDPTCPLWKSWTVAGLTSVCARNGLIAYGGTGGLYVLDLIADKVFQRTASALNICTNQTVATFNQSTATWAAVSSAGAIVNATVNDLAKTTQPASPASPLRASLPDPTRCVATAGGGSVIRADGAVVNSASTTAIISCAFDLPARKDIAPNLWTLTSAALNVTNQYLSASWNVSGLATFTAAQLGIGTLKSVRAIGPNTVAVAGSTGLAQIKLDPVVPANSMISVKTATFDTGWMLGAQGLIKAAFAESSADTTALVGSGELITNGNFGTNDWTGWTQASTTADLGTFTATGGIGTIANGATGYAYAYQAITTVVGRRYRWAMTGYTGTSTDYMRIGSTAGNTFDVANLNNSSSGALFNGTFVATSTTTYVTLTTAQGAAGTTGKFSTVSVQACIADRSASSVVPANHAIVNGSGLTRALFNSTTDIAGYGGFDATSYPEVPANAGLDYGTGDFFGAALVKPTALGTGVIFSYGLGGSAGWSLFQWVTNQMYVAIGAAQYQIVGFQPPAGVVSHVAVVRMAGVLYFFLNGVKVFSTAAAGTVSAVGATLCIGNGANNTAAGAAYPYNGLIGQIRYGAIAQTPDQIAFMAASDLASLQGKNLLSGANVQGLSFDVDTGQLAVSNSTAGTDIFGGVGLGVRVNNQRSTTGANLFKGSALPEKLTYTAASLGSKVSAFASWGSEAWQFLDTAANVQHYSSFSWTAAGSQAYGLTAPFKAAAQGFGFVALSSNPSISAYVNLATGAVGTTSGSPTVTVSALASGEWLVTIVGTPNVGGQQAYVQSAASNGGITYLGTGAAAIIFGKPMLTLGSSVPTAYSDGLTLNDNHKGAAFAGGDLIIATGAGVDAILAAADGLRATAKGRKVGAPYDPTWGQFYGATTDATPTVFASVPIAEGKAYRFRATVAAAQYGGTATEKATYDITGIVSRDIGGNVVVVTTTTTVSEVTSTMDCIAQANTTAQTLELKGTGKAATRIAWLGGLELYDLGLMAAA